MTAKPAAVAEAPGPKILSREEVARIGGEALRKHREDEARKTAAAATPNAPKAAPAPKAVTAKAVEEPKAAAPAKAEFQPGKDNVFAYTDAEGVTHTRTTKTKPYTHAVYIHAEDADSTIKALRTRIATHEAQAKAFTEAAKNPEFEVVPRRRSNRFHPGYETRLKLPKGVPNPEGSGSLSNFHHINNGKDVRPDVARRAGEHAQGHAESADKLRKRLKSLESGDLSSLDSGGLGRFSTSHKLAHQAATGQVYESFRKEGRRVEVVPVELQAPKAQQKAARKAAAQVSPNAPAAPPEPKVATAKAVDAKAAPSTPAVKAVAAKSPGVSAAKKAAATQKATAPLAKKAPAKAAATSIQTVSEPPALPKGPRVPETDARRALARFQAHKDYAESVRKSNPLAYRDHSREAAQLFRDAATARTRQPKADPAVTPLRPGRTGERTVTPPDDFQAGAAVGSVREYLGKKFIKDAQGKWVAVTDKTNVTAAAARYRKAAMSAASDDTVRLSREDDVDRLLGMLR